MEWLKEIFDRLLSVFPRIRILTGYQAGVRFTLGKHARALGPGWYLQWPWFQEWDQMDTPSQTADLRCQAAHSKDGVDMAIGGGVRFRIVDIVKAICSVVDVDEALSTIALGVILKYVNQRDFSDCHDPDDLEKEILKGLRESAQGWGVKIEKVFITDIGRSINVRLLQ